jgi:signal transduction histidine kinase
MTLELAQIAAASWPWAISLTAVAGVGGLRAGRRRNALNEALHELRRPLQALALTAPQGSRSDSAGAESTVWVAAAALERLDREINGAPAAAVRAPLPARSLVAAALERWRGQAEGAGRSLALEWMAGSAVVRGDRCQLSQALDNLIVNAIEHGGAAIVVTARAHAGRLQIAVADSGGGSRSRSRREGSTALLARLSGKRRHGHGLRLVGRTAKGHCGGFRLERSEAGTRALLELPLLDEPRCLA